MPLLVSMGDDIEKAVGLAGADRERVRKHVWECRCRDRRKRYQAVLRWAKESLTAGSSEKAAATLERLLSSS